LAAREIKHDGFRIMARRGVSYERRSREENDGEVGEGGKRSKARAV